MATTQQSPKPRKAAAWLRREVDAVGRVMDQLVLALVQDLHDSCTIAYAHVLAKGVQARLAKRLAAVEARRKPAA